MNINEQRPSDISKEYVGEVLPGAIFCTKVRYTNMHTIKSEWALELWARINEESACHHDESVH